MTPILVRPVREQLEHDRVIRLLQAKWRRKYLVTVNLGAEQTASIPCGGGVIYPDLLLASADRGHRPAVVVEVETGESVNGLEARAQWVPLGRVRPAFHLYVPTGSVDSARRLCEDHAIGVDEIWSYHPVGDQMRFTMVHKAPTTSRPTPRPSAASPRRGKPVTSTARRSSQTRKPAVASRRPVAKRASKPTRPKPVRTKPPKPERSRTKPTGPKRAARATSTRSKPKATARKASVRKATSRRRR